MDSRFLMTLQVALGSTQKIGAVPHGTRVIAQIASGHFEGPRLHGKVLPGGGDWTLLRGDGVLELLVGRSLAVLRQLVAWLLGAQR